MLSSIQADDCNAGTTCAIAMNAIHNVFDLWNRVNKEEDADAVRPAALYVAVPPFFATAAAAAEEATAATGAAPDAIMHTSSSRHVVYPGCMISKGAFARVYACDGGNNVVKVLTDVTQSQAVIEFHRERMILRALSENPHVVGLVDGGLMKEVYDAQDGVMRPAFKMPYAGHALADLLLDCRGDDPRVSPAAKRDYVAQLLRAVEHLHAANVCHRDIKLENMTVDATGRMRLIDFGFACLMPHSSLLTHPCGTIKYAAPEVLAPLPYSGTAVDAWSVGVCVFTIHFAFFPLDAAHRSDWRYPLLCAAQKRGESTTRTVLGFYDKTRGYKLEPPPDVRRVVDALLVANPNERAKASVRLL